MKNDQHSIVTDQFGQQAREYVTSPTHAAGWDLDWMETTLGAAPQARVLDLGCGGGHVTYRSAPHVGQVVACDLSNEMLAVVSAEASERGISNLTTQQAAAEELPFDDASFDFVLCRLSAHHWSDLAAGLRETSRVLRPGGRAIFVDSYSPGTALLDTHLQAVEVLRDPSHVRNYTFAEWSAAFVAANLMPTILLADKRRIDFPTWIKRMRTPANVADAIRYLQSRLPDTAKRHFEIEEDGSFMLGTICIAADKE